uniref:Uncharacterized protein n=1 Tax=Arundo donax TaxID=35708 RepID=A0A0A9BJT9_ARUDO
MFHSLNKQAWKKDMSESNFYPTP